MKIEKRAEALVWTALMSGFNRGLQTAFKSENYEKFTWVNTKKHDTCKLCRSMNGVVLTLEEAGKLIPLHSNCQCILMPKVEME